MSHKQQDDSTARRVPIYDDAYQDWLAAAGDSRCALRAWLDGPPREQSGLYVAYRASLDREEAAATRLERLCAGDAGARVVPAAVRRRRHRFAAPVVHEIPPPSLGG